MKPDLYLWLDLETTGLDEKRDRPLELGLIVTDRKLHTLAESSWVFAYDLWDGRHEIDPFVVGMHTKNGLWGECQQSALLASIAGPEIVQWIASVCDDRVVRLAGSGIGHFDARWVDYWWPQITESCMVGYLDVGVLRRFWEEVCDRDVTVKDVPHGNHRALADLRRFIAEAKWLREAV